MTSEAQKKASSKWDKNNSKLITVKLPRVAGEQFKEFVEAKGLTANAVIKQLIFQYMQDNGISIDDI